MPCTVSASRNTCLAIHRQTSGMLTWFGKMHSRVDTVRGWGLMQNGRRSSKRHTRFSESVWEAQYARPDSTVPQVEHASPCRSAALHANSDTTHPGLITKRGNESHRAYMALCGTQTAAYGVFPGEDTSRMTPTRAEHAGSKPHNTLAHRG